SNDQILQRELYDLAGKYLQLRENIENYDSYLTEHLLWIQSSHALSFIIFSQLPSEIKQYVTHLSDEIRGLKKLSLRDLLFLLMPLSLAALLIFFRSDLLVALINKGKTVGHVKYDSILHTINALIYTTLLTLPWAIIILTLSWTMKLPTSASVISVQLANAGIYTAISLFAVQFIKILCIDKGVVEVHFKREVKGLLKFVKELNIFIYFAIPCYFITLSSISLFPATLGGSLAILSFTAVMFTLVRIILSILHPTNGFIYQLPTPDTSLSSQTKKIIFYFIMCIPIAIVIMFLAGYIYTAGVISERLYYSIFFAAVIWIIHSLSSRWLLITSKRLAYENLVKAKRARFDRLKATESENTDLNHDDPLEQAIDLKTLDGDTQKLINAATLVLAVTGLFGIWEQMLPALSFLEHVDLWNKTLIVDGKELLIAVTLGEVLAALLVAFAGYILSQNLPSLLNILLLKGGKVSPGARYAIVTLTSYSTVIISILIIMNLLGISSSKLGWMFAALSVGIGFGLQEIVANFICGLILLFERPIRVGDVISIGSSGDSSGTVIRIRIRATTIRDFDEKELLIPNKELITGRVLNWTLSDEITRIFINVGIAYGSDVELAMSIIEEVATENERTLEDPAPFVNFEKFADSSLSLTLRAYVPTQRDRLRTITQLHKEIDKRFRIANINIAFPQHDVHVISHETVKSTS
ncbi:MAG: mechanosensitive ion channel domain-containing protein, partial [Psychromonas sp.]